MYLKESIEPEVWNNATLRYRGRVVRTSSHSAEILGGICMFMHGTYTDKKAVKKILSRKRR